MTRKFDSDRLLVATHNKGKLEEMAHLLEPFGVRVIGAGEMNLPEPDETEDTFVGNARIKAHAAAKVTGLPALSDDSGITIDALDGAPGVYTADWAETGNGRDFLMAMTRAHEELEAKNAPHPRTAQFRSTLVLAWPDGHDEVFEGIAPGPFVAKVVSGMIRCLSRLGMTLPLPRWIAGKRTRSAIAVARLRCS
jgi:XTP/dITP diphosphohydrolase